MTLYLYKETERFGLNAILRDARSAASNCIHTSILIERHMIVMVDRGPIISRKVFNNGGSLAVLWGGSGTTVYKTAAVQRTG